MKRLLFASLLSLACVLPSFALKVSGNHRFLQTDDGAPFFYLADTAWELFHRLDREEATRYLDNRAALGYTAVQAVAIAELDGVRRPNAYGHLPFKPGTAEPDVKDGPANDYWDHVDFIVEAANARGIYVAMLPTWGSWWREGKVFTRESAKAYATWLARRYAQKGIVWVLGGDRPIENDKDVAMMRAFAEGLREGDGGRNLITVHPCGGHGSSERLHDEPWLDFNFRQNGHTIDYPRYAETRTDYDRTPVKPVIDGEPVYEGHPVDFNPDALGHTVAADVRRALYWDLFNGACGHTYGHHSVWQMFKAKAFPEDGINRPLMPWHVAIDEPGAAQMRYAKELLLSHPYFTRIPAPEMIVADAVTSLVPGAGTRRFAATRDAKGSYAFVYVPVGRSVTVSLKDLAAERLSFAWMNPRDGSYSPWTSFKRTATRRFDPPTPGELLDWVLVVEADDGLVFVDETYPMPDDPACARYELTCLKETGETLVVTGAVETAGIRPLAEGLHAIKPLAGQGETVRFLAINPPAAYDPSALAKTLPHVAAKIRAGEGAVLFFAGDSVTATGDYGAMLAQMLRRATGNRNIRAAKHAYAGCSADASVRNFTRDTAVDRPDAVFVMYGLNDAACSIPTRVFAEELSWLAREAKSRFSADAVYLTPTPHFDVFINEKGVPSNPPEFARRTIGFGELVRQTGLQDGVTVVDAFDAIWSIGGGAPILETAEKARTLYPPAYFRQFEAMGEKTGDTIHPNALGHLRLARRTYETLMGRAKGPQPVTTAEDLPVDPPCWAEMASRPASPIWVADGKDVLHLGLPAHATGSSGRVEDNRASADEGTSDWRVSVKGEDLVFTVTTAAANREDSFNLFFDPRPAEELGTMGPYYWLECRFRDGGVVSLRPGESTTSGARATGTWTEKDGQITAEITVPARLFDAASPRFPLGFSLVWRHTGPNGKGTRLSWSERCHEWNPMGYGKILGAR